MPSKTRLIKYGMRKAPKKNKGSVQGHLVNRTSRKYIPLLTSALTETELLLKTQEKKDSAFLKNRLGIEVGTARSFLYTHFF